MGFDVDSARAALHRFGGATERAIEELLTLGGIAPPDWLRAMQTAADATSTGASVSQLIRISNESAFVNDRITCSNNPLITCSIGARLSR